MTTSGMSTCRVRIWAHVLSSAALKRAVADSAVMPPWNAVDMYVSLLALSRHAEQLSIVFYKSQLATGGCAVPYPCPGRSLGWLRRRSSGHV